VAIRILFVHLGRENIGVEYLSSVLKLAGHEVFSAVDIGLFGLNDNIFHVPRLERMFSLKESVVERFRSLSPDLVCFSAYTSTIKWCFSVAEEFKKIRDVPIVIGGIHTTIAPESATICPAIDYGIRGEAESVIAEFAECAANRRTPDHIPGAIFRKDGKTIVNGFAPLTADLDSLPFPDKELFAKYIRIKDDYMVSVARGCPNNCAYCCEHVVRKACGDPRYCRVRGVNSLMEELNVMKSKYGFTEVFFCSPIFPGDKAWVEEFSSRYKKEIGVPFWCFAHVSNIDRDYARLMREAGCRILEFGVQSVNETLRRDVLGRRESNQRISSALADCDSERIRYDIGHIFRLPGETEEDYREAVRFYSTFKKIHRIKTFNLTLFPGTRMLDICREKQLIGGNDEAAVGLGDSGDYFHVSSVTSDVPEWRVKAYGHILRFLPFLPSRFLLSFLNSDSRLKMLSRFPSSFAKIIELCYLIIIRDMRLKIFFKLYLKHAALLMTRRRGA